MPFYFYSYDITSNHPNPHQALVQAAIDRLLTYVYGDQDRVFRLPASTLWGHADDLIAAQSQ
ncbi:MAG: hypothetical protein ACRYGP_07230, partial [Janthinobacterium lividum]